MAGPAIVDVLLGSRNPSARMPVTTPRCVGQVPIHYDSKNTGRPISKDNPKQKYKSNYLDVANSPLYPFGYGLSYTSFSYSNLSLSKKRVTMDQTLKVRIELRNEGNRSGEEVVQVYIRDLVASQTRPIRQLIDFKKVKLAARSGKTVEFHLRAKDLGFFRADGSYITEAGDFMIYVGPNSQEGLSAKFSLWTQ